MTAPDRNDRRARRVWARMLQWYGDRFSEQYGAEPNESWRSAIARASDDEVGGALTQVRSQYLAFPPTLPQFEAAIRAQRRPVNEIPISTRLTEHVMDHFRMTDWQMRSWSFLQRRTEGFEEGRGPGIEIVGVVIPADPQDPHKFPAVRFMAVDLPPLGETA